ncbi:hypothetical protein [Cryobacterium tagatosivorans]|uniref:Uncharacterized protein n=1 Tax=Cryobacterium tagatosivorans TaxID=1259199 RepID=A0A4R8UD41_9MICO|nr:hypothetical protein [Cryobacterium tagatosivorans]TFB46778.1 hypothetical protein E3O23_16630 [Cryobacterium tagatosivorans]
MMRVTYAGASFLTSDDIANGLFQFVAALGDNNAASSLEVPAFTDDGKAVMVRLVVGPASELVGVPEESILEEPNTVDFVSELHKRTLALSSPRPVVDTEAGFTTAYDWDDLQ